MPAQIMICGQPWSVEYVTGLRDSGALGLTHDSQRLIMVDADQARISMTATLLHEALHACMELSSLRLMSDEQEEQIVTALEPVLLSLLRDNAPWWRK